MPRLPFLLQRSDNMFHLHRRQPRRQRSLQSLLVIKLAIVFAAAIAGILLPVAEATPSELTTQQEEDETRFYEVRARYYRRWCAETFGDIPDFYGRESGDSNTNIVVATKKGTRGYGKRGRGKSCECGVLHGTIMFLSDGVEVVEAWGWNRLPVVLGWNPVVDGDWNRLPEVPDLGWNRLPEVAVCEPANANPDVGLAAVVEGALNE